MILNFLIRQYHLLLLLLLLAVFHGTLAYFPLMYPLSHAHFILYCSLSTVLPYSNSWWSHHSGGWFFHCLHGLLVSWPFPPVSSTLLHTSDLLYNNNVLIIIVTLTPSIIPISSTRLSDHYLSPFQLTPSNSNKSFCLTGAYNPLILLPLHCSLPHSLSCPHSFLYSF